MEGDRRITLREPGATTENSYGETVAGPFIEHFRWASRRDRGISEGVGVEAATVVGEWDTVFRVRQVGIEHITQGWGLVDDRGIAWDIDRIREVPVPRRRWWNLYCIART